MNSFLSSNTLLSNKWIALVLVVIMVVITKPAFAMSASGQHVMHDNSHAPMAHTQQMQHHDQSHAMMTDCARHLSDQSKSDNCCDDMTQCHIVTGVLPTANYAFSSPTSTTQLSTYHFETPVSPCENLYRPPIA
ncbi:hypothetical protein [Photobacterium damselae]|uniref:hypothetical protein n=1 Tax=Photobacterium damselae TaxID=38293 RepID=UPI00083A8F14|nr:hypothetical protein [Photobacterium damselae]NVO74770.1 hypothetical protein [Photobacterium damselae subsp. damselae]PSB80273.1 hypothetical protein C5F64_18875 [Photobacterium damselae subsp. damselae]QSH56577.1 hypothetical protein A0J47_011685 [Photobacterium damselae subsp. damselae]UKA01070.1 hypothetical protein IHC89_10230 [Photobacterium damselae subsp. damselae]SPY24972.1 Uncharacterised protein [Photobacterium damselae]